MIGFMVFSASLNNVAWVFTTRTLIVLLSLLISTLVGLRYLSVNSLTPSSVLQSPLSYSNKTSALCPRSIPAAGRAGSRRVGLPHGYTHASLADRAVGADSDVCRYFWRQMVSGA